jgi:hypothetical protein
VSAEHEGIDVIDVSGEARREYYFPNPSGAGMAVVGVLNPQALAIHDDGHWLTTETGGCFIPFGWVCMRFYTRKDEAGEPGPMVTPGFQDN